MAAPRFSSLGEFETFRQGRQQARQRQLAADLAGLRDPGAITARQRRFLSDNEADRAEENDLYASSFLTHDPSTDEPMQPARALSFATPAEDSRDWQSRIAREQDVATRAYQAQVQQDMERQTRENAARADALRAAGTIDYSRPAQQSPGAASAPRVRQFRPEPSAPEAAFRRPQPAPVVAATPAQDNSPAAILRRSLTTPTLGMDAPIGGSVTGTDGKTYYRFGGGWSNSPTAIARPAAVTSAPPPARSYDDTLRQNFADYEARRKATALRRLQGLNSVRSILRGRDGIMRTFDYQRPLTQAEIDTA